MSYFKDFGLTMADNGYAVIPVQHAAKEPGFPGAGAHEKKGDFLPNWQSFLDNPADDETLEKWAAHSVGVGLLTGTVIGIDIDIVTSPALANDFERKVLEIVGVDSAPTRTGQFPKRALFFRATEPIASRSRKFKGSFGADGIDIMSRGRYMVAYGIHPKTNREYIWRNGNPQNTAVDQLAPITQAQCDAILALDPANLDGAPAPAQADLLPSPEPSTQSAPPSATPVVGNATDHDVAAVKWLVEHLPNDETTTWDDWVKIGFAIHEALKDAPDAGKFLYHQWSARNPAKYDSTKTERKWKTIVRDSRGTVGMGTLIKLARANNIKIPPEIQFDDLSGLPEVDLSEYAARLVSVSIVADEATGKPLVSAWEYAVWLYYIDTTPDDVEGGRLARLAARCPGMTPPTQLSSEELEHVRKRIGEALALAQTQDVESIIEPSVSNDEHRQRYLNWSGALDGGDSDNKVSLNKDLEVCMTPSVKPLAPDAARWAPPGVLAEFATWAASTAPTKVKEFAVTGGIALVATIIGRAVKSPTNIRPNIYVLNVAPSSSGKNHALGCLKRALSSVGILSRHVLGSNVTSSAAIRNAFERAAGDKNWTLDRQDLLKPDGTAMSKLLISDEIGSFWAANSASGNAHAAGVMGDLLSFYSGAGEIMPGTAMASKAASELPYPHLNLLGCSAQNALFDSMTREQLAQGHVNRFLLVEPTEIVYRTYQDKLSYWNGQMGSSAVPPGVVSTVHALSRWCDYRQGLGANAWEDAAEVLPFTLEAATFMAGVDELKDMCARHASANSGVVFEPFGRMAEMTVRLAMISAMSRLTQKIAQDGEGNPVVIGVPAVELIDCQWGFEIARYSAMRFAYMMRAKGDDVNPNSPEAKICKFVAKNRTGVRVREVRRILKMAKGDCDKRIAGLVESQSLAVFRKVGDRKDTQYVIAYEALAEWMASGADMTQIYDASWTK